MALGRAACARLVGAPHMLTIRTYTNYEHVFTASAPGDNASVEHDENRWHLQGEKPALLSS
jgi:hypothetical protein